MLSFLLNKDITEFTFQPYDQIMAEPENGVAFIDYEKRTVLVHTLNMIEKWGPAIYFISGPRCLTRGSASFLVERVQAPNLTYNQLSFISTDSKQLMERLLAAGPKVTLFSTVLPQFEWDTVCYLGPRTKSSKVLSSILNENLIGFVFEPYDQITGDDEYGLAFIDHRSRRVLVFALDLAQKKGESARHEVTGPRCLKKETASFQVVRVDSPNGSFNRLVFLPTG